MFEQDKRYNLFACYFFLTDVFYLLDFNILFYFAMGTLYEATVMILTITAMMIEYYEAQ
jgi:hypothetical protein